jgi:adenine-specific DNA-methyltransferase
MKFTPLSPKKSLNKAFLRQRPTRQEIDIFKQNLIRLLGKIDEIEREENQKNHLRDFLRDTYYKETNEVNTKGTIDLVVHLGKSNKDSVGVIAEAKRPSNKGEMFSIENPNSKALGEIILYYMEERITANNNELKNLLITNVNEWYIIDANYFDKHIYRNSKIKKLFELYKNDKKDTPFFYDEVSKIIPSIDVEIPCTYFDIRAYKKWLLNDDKTDDKNLIPLLKILSPYHLLKVKFADDSNTLDNLFYKELLHIIGLEEVKESGKLIIRRKNENRNEASLLENAIEQLKTVGLHKITDRSNLGANSDENYFNVALELCITWMNRILFLKLLEGQLVSYHQGDKEFRFLNSEMIFDYDELAKLFHKVLAVDFPSRKPEIQTKYFRVPYLNSSLFEIGELEDQTIKVNELDNSLLLDLMNNSVLKEQKKKGEKLNTLSYFFQFLNAYDFASEGSDDVKEDSKTIINASVLGKVFEKINGYKDGSIFTPGFITMYMCRQTIRMAVVQKFRDAYGWNVEQFDDLKNYMADRRSVKDLLEFNALINSLHLCDPAVGSGHFLVSALNELIVIKYELGILVDEVGVRMTSYELDVINDELIITDPVTVDPFKYLMVNGRPQSKEIQRLQKTLFHEKQTIIENCLFGVDINPNSVKICRLRLWIELLKSAYYRAGVDSSAPYELETLPNIDINIKCGNSLISRFPLDVNIKDALKKTGYSIEEYRNFVAQYRSVKNRDAKRELQGIIDSIKTNFKANIDDPFKLTISKARAAETNLMSEINRLEQWDEKVPKTLRVKLEKTTQKLADLEKKLKDILSNKIFIDSFEWRFEFPEILNDDGVFIGFDIVVGNPPYKMIQPNNTSLQEIEYMKSIFPFAEFKIDLFHLFFQQGLFLTKNDSYLSFIAPSSLLNNVFVDKLRSYLDSNNRILSIAVAKNKVFEDADVHTAIYHFQKGKNFDKEELVKTTIMLESVINNTESYNLISQNLFSQISNNIWNLLLNEQNKSIIEKVSKHIKLSDLVSINRGLISGDRDKYFSKTKETDSHVEILSGSDIQRYCHVEPMEYVLFDRPKTAGGCWDKDVHLAPFKVCIRQIGVQPTATLIEKPYAVTGNIFTFTSSDILLLKNVLAIINSKLIKFYWQIMFADFKTSFPQITINSLSQIPINVENNEINEKINYLVDQILIAKQENIDTTKLESDIDKLVYKLYDLTDEEVKVIDPEFGLSMRK